MCIRKMMFVFELFIITDEKTLILAQGGTSILRGRVRLAQNFVSEILVGAPNFASKNINDKYSKFCPLNFRYDPKIGTFSTFASCGDRTSQIFPLIW